MKYKDAGVDVERGYAAVKKIKEIVSETFNENVLTGIGDFGASYALPGKNSNTILVSGTDGVGTKLKLAFAANLHDTIGIDCVAMCVNDVLCSGARPLFFLDYLATGKIDPDQIASIVSGIAEGCKQSGAALIGGETAEMPGFYANGEYDLAGFAVGIVDKSELISKKNVHDGDVIIGLASSGIHSNGYSLVRKIFSAGDYDKTISGEKIIDILLKPTRIYVSVIHDLIKNCSVQSMAHITGGGFYENIPRALPDDLGAEININSWKIPAIFTAIEKKANLQSRDMFSTFNMGIGFVVIVKSELKNKALEFLKKNNEKAYLIGTVKKKKVERLWFQ